MNHDEVMACSIYRFPSALVAHPDPLVVGLPTRHAGARVPRRRVR